MATRPTLRNFILLAGRWCWLVWLLAASVGWESGIGGLFYGAKFRVVWAVENLGQVGEITCWYFPGCVQAAAGVQPARPTIKELRSRRVEPASRAVARLMSELLD